MACPSYTKAIPNPVPQIGTAMAARGCRPKMSASIGGTADASVKRLREEMSWSSEAIPPLAEALKLGAPAHIVEDEFME
jgi:hypothetical protein